MSIVDRIIDRLDRLFGGPSPNLSDIEPESVKAARERRIRQDLAIARYSRVVALRQCLDICHDSHDVLSEKRIRELYNEALRNLP